MHIQFNKLLLATVIGASLVTSVYGATDGNATIELEQRAHASADAEQALPGAPGAPLTSDETLATVAEAGNQATQHMSAVIQAAGALQQTVTTDLEALDASASAMAGVALTAASGVSGEGTNLVEQIQAGASSTADAVTSQIQSGKTAIVDGANSSRADIAQGSSVAAQALPSGQAATANLSEQTSAAIQGQVSSADALASGAAGLSQSVLGQVELAETTPVSASGLALPALPVDGAVPAAAATSVPTPELVVNGRAQADISAGLTADTQRLNLNTRQTMQSDVGFSSTGGGSANTTLGSSIGGGVGGITSGVRALGTGSLLR